MKRIFLLTLLTALCIGAFGQITVVSPNGGENWVTGTTHPITWTTTLTTGALRIQLIRGTFATTIAENIPLTSSFFQWAIPATIQPGQEYKIKLSTYSNTPTGIVFSDLSDGFFTITGGTNPPPALTVVSPNGGENWVAGTAHPITWTYSNLEGNVVIQLLTPYPTFAPVILAEVPVSACNFVWTIPAGTEAVPGYRISIYKQNSTGVIISDTSDGDFTISSGVNLQSITVLSPNGGEVWEIGSTHQIAWNYTNLTGNVRIELISPMSNTLPIIISPEYPIANSPFNWTIPNMAVPGNMYRVAVTWLSMLTVYIGDMSDNNFSITGNPVVPTLTILTPNGGENWAIGSTHDITWTFTNVTGNVRLELISPLMTPVANIIAEVPVTAGVFHWTIPNTIVPASFYQICISKIYSTGVVANDISDSTFTISGDFVPSSITVISPNGGENWELGNTYPITWTYTNLTGEVRIDLISPLMNFLPTQIAVVPIANGVFNWTIPNSVLPLSSYRIAITWLSMLTVYFGDVSDADFTISGTPVVPTITVTSPNGGENWQVGTAHPITWTSTDLTGNISIFLVGTDNPSTNMLVIARDIPNTGLFNWIIPNIPGGTSYRVHIRSVLNAAINDMSDNPFTISSGVFNRIRVLAPNGGEIWRHGDTRRIRWVCINTGTVVGAVEISLIRGGNSTTNTLPYIIAPDAPNTGSFLWTIPPNIPVGRNYKVKIRLLDNIGGADVSDNFFAIIYSPISITGVNKKPDGKVEVTVDAGDEHPVTVSVYNIKGQCIRDLVSEEKISGNRTIHWDGTDAKGQLVKKGLFFVRAQSGKDVVTKKFMY